MSQPPSDPPPYGRPPDGAPQYGQPQYGQTPYGAPQFEQPQYGQPQYGAPQFGQPQHGSPQYGSPQYGQPQYGQYGPPSTPPGRSRQVLIWSIAGGVALVAVIVTLVVLFTGSGGPEPAPAATREPTGLGDDPVLDELARSCYDGDMGACDDLYLESEFDSAYERYGDTCAGRKDAGTWSLCTDDFEDAPAGGGR